MFWKYLGYLLRHKWFVFLECRRGGLLWRGIIHDLSKFKPSEFIPYARHFYGPKPNVGIGTGRDKAGYYKPTETGDLKFEMAWLLHLKRNRHHWQWWVIPESPEDKILPMPSKDVLEMICDWRGAGRAQNTMDNNKFDWYEKNKIHMKLHQKTEQRILLALKRAAFMAEAVVEEK